MLRWELYVNFFYSWIIFSLRCHQLNFQYYIEMNIHHRVRAFERSSGKKEKIQTQNNTTQTPQTLFVPLSAAVNTGGSLWFPNQAAALGQAGLCTPRDVPVALQVSPRWDRGTRWELNTNLRVYRTGGCRNNKKNDIPLIS